tara:strand:- start:102 stop:488 length:387 start_codon:yes stop_codon:yes gene_type:complete
MEKDKKIYEATILGTVVSKSNSYRVGMKKGAGKYIPIMTKSYKLREYEMMFRKCLPSVFHKVVIEKRFRLEMDVYFTRNANDLDNTPKVVLDCLQHVGFITNDNLCFEIVLRKHLAPDAKINFKISEL